jgi:hypothetical protein
MLLEAGYSEEQVEAGLHALNSIARPIEVRQTLSMVTEHLWPPNTVEGWTESAVDRCAQELGRHLVSKGPARVFIGRTDTGEREVRVVLMSRAPIGVAPEGLRGPWTWRNAAR